MHPTSRADGRLTALKPAFTEPVGLLCDQPLQPTRMALMAVSEEIEAVRWIGSEPKKLFIDGRWVEAAGGKTFPTLAPATGEALIEVAHGGNEDVDRAVKAARRSFEAGDWRELPPSERAKVLWKVASTRA